MHPRTTAWRAGLSRSAARQAGSVPTSTTPASGGASSGTYTQAAGPDTRHNAPVFGLLADSFAWDKGAKGS